MSVLISQFTNESIYMYLHYTWYKKLQKKLITYIKCLKNKFFVYANILEKKYFVDLTLFRYESITLSPQKQTVDNFSCIRTGSTVDHRPLHSKERTGRAHHDLYVTGRNYNDTFVRIAPGGKSAHLRSSFRTRDGTRTQSIMHSARSVNRCVGRVSPRPSSAIAVRAGARDRRKFDSID